MPGLGDQFPTVNPGDPITAGGWNDIVRQLHALASIGDAGAVMATGAGIFRRSSRRQKKDPCDYYHEIYIDGNPSSGNSTWDYTIDTVTQTVTITFDMTPAQLATEFITQFSPDLTADDLEVTGGPLPQLHLYVRWKTTAGQVDYPPLVNASTLTNDALMKIGQINPRS